MADETKETAPFTLNVENGPDRGREVPVRDEAITIGRSSSNAVALADPILSRHHCLVVVENGSLMVEDLSSANGTIVNGALIDRRTALKDGDTITLGDTILSVHQAQSAAAQQQAASPQVIDLGPAPVSQESSIATRDSSTGGEAAPVVDLGFDKPDAVDDAAKKPNWRPLLWGVAALAVFAVAASIILRQPEEAPAPVFTAPKPPAITPLEIIYEKTEASTGGVFRYCMELSPSGVLSVEIDDMAEDRHVRKEAAVPSNRIERLARELDSSGFGHLSPKYEGVAHENVMNALEITLVLGDSVKRSEVVNRVEPEVFRNVRETLETFGKNELGIWAIQFSRERLVELSKEALTRASNFFDERGIDYGNLYKSIKRYEEAAFYLDTVDPKPDFYADIVSGLATATEELNQRYEERRFLADRAINLKDWTTAASELRVIRELIPDRDDERHAEAGRKLLDVETRMKAKDR